MVPGQLVGPATLKYILDNTIYSVKGMDILLELREKLYLESFVYSYKHVIR